MLSFFLFFLSFLLSFLRIEITVAGAVSRSTPLFLCYSEQPHSRDQIFSSAIDVICRMVSLDMVRLYFSFRDIYLAVDIDRSLSSVR